MALFIEGRLKIKGLFIVVILISSYCGLYAQVDLDWWERYGGEEREFGHDIVTTQEGDYLLAGRTNSFNGNGFDFYLVKSSIHRGEELWSRTYDSGNHDLCFSLIETADGGYAMAGCSWIHDWGHQFSVVKTGADGEEEWMRFYGEAAYHDHCVEIIQSSDRGYVLIGNRYRWDDNRYAHDWYIVKTDSTGEQEWDLVFGDSYVSDRCGSICEKEDGHFLVIGSCDTNEGRSLFAIVELSSDGDTVWTRRYQNGLISGGRIRRLSDSCYVVLGLMEDDQEDRSICLIKINENGIINDIINCNDSFKANDLLIVNDGDFVIAGQKRLPNRLNVYYLLYIDKNGDPCFSWLHGNNVYGANRILQAIDGGFVLFGSRCYEENYWDYWLVKTGPVGQGVGWNNIHSKTESYEMISACPNPFNNITGVQVQLNHSRFITLSVCDAMGKLLETLFEGYFYSGKKTFAWNATDHPTGLYLIRLTDQFGDCLTYKTVYIK